MNLLHQVPDLSSLRTPYFIGGLIGLGFVVLVIVVLYFSSLLSLPFASSMVAGLLYWGSIFVSALSVFSLILSGTAPHSIRDEAVERNLQVEAQTVYGVKISATEAQELDRHLDTVNDNYETVEQTASSKKKYQEFGTISHLNTDSEVSKIQLIRLNGKYLLVYEGGSASQKIHELPRD